MPTGKFVFTAFAAAFAAFASQGPGRAADQTIIARPVASLDWQRTPEGVAFAGLMGDRFQEAYMAMVRLPAGTVSPPHVKTANMFGVMISGAMVHHAPGSDPDRQSVLGPGAFYKIPRGLPHVERCVSDVECVTFLYQDGKFDFLPVDQ